MPESASSALESVATRAAKRALEFQDRMKARIDEDLAAGIGYEEASKRRTRRLIRQAIAGDQGAMAEIEQMASTNQHQPGDDCGICQEANQVLKGG